MEVDKVIELMKSMDASGITSLEFTQGEDKLSLKKELVTGGFVEGNVQISPKQEKNQAEEEFYESPMIGTFYESRKEGEEPYVKAGDHVVKGQVIGIIEAMKLMNEVVAEFDGTVVEVMVDNEQLVEYGQKLMKVRRD